MIGQTITDENGKPLQGVRLSKSPYQPSREVMELWSKCQTDYQTAWRLQHRPFGEFDDNSLLQRAKLDQELWGSYVGAQYLPQHKRWRWRGRKNTARNKLIGMLAHMLAGMLYPLVTASDEENDTDKMSARVMRILVENHLRKAGYETKFLYMVCSALVNPAVIVELEYLEAWQRIKQGGNVIEAIDDTLTGLMLNILPIDQFLIGDFYTPDVQRQPFVIKIRRIPYDTARKIYGHNPNFKYVQAGKTRVLLAGQEHVTLYDIEWTEGDRYSVQEATFYYRDEDLEVTFLGGVFMGNEENPYNSNPFSHRRQSLIGDQWVSIPVYQFAKSFFEPIDPTGRFFYGKSGAFKQYWDDQTQNKMHQLLVDGTYLDVFKPMFIQGLAKVDSTVIAPGAVIGIPPGANAEQYALGSNLAAAYQALIKQETDMAESTQDKIMEGNATPGVTATQSIQAQNQARIFMGVFGLLLGDLIRQVGDLTVDCTIQHTTSMEVDSSVPATLRVKDKVVLARSKEKGRDLTNKVVFTDKIMGRQMSSKEITKYEWRLYDEVHGIKRDKEGKIASRDHKDGESGMMIYHVNPYKFARNVYSMYVDPDQITNHAMGNNRLQKLAAFQMLTDPRVAPYTDPKNVVDDFVIEEYSEGDPDRYKAKGNVNAMMGSIMGQQGGQPGQPGQGAPSPLTKAMVGAPSIKDHSTMGML